MMIRAVATSADCNRRTGEGNCLFVDVRIALQNAHPLANEKSKAADFLAESSKIPYL
jgi:hypothetical protein